MKILSFRWDASFNTLTQILFFSTRKRHYNIIWSRMFQFWFIPIDCRAFCSSPWNSYPFRMLLMPTNRLLYAPGKSCVQYYSCYPFSLRSMNNFFWQRVPEKSIVNFHQRFWHESHCENNNDASRETTKNRITAPFRANRMKYIFVVRSAIIKYKNRSRKRVHVKRTL